MVEYDIGNNNVITVIAGIDGSIPPLDIQMSIEHLGEDMVNKGLDFRLHRDSVTLTIDEQPTDERKEIFGYKTQYIMMFDVNIGDKSIRDMVNPTHNTIVTVLNDNGFNITGTATIWDGEYHG